MTWRAVVHSGRPWLQLDISVPHNSMLSEAVSLREHFVDRCAPQENVAHQYPNYYGVGWHALTLHGLPGDQVGHYAQYGYPHEVAVPYTWTEHALDCPVTVAWLQNEWPMKRLYRVRFLLLEPGGSIKEHQDNKSPGLDRASIALRYPEGCEFLVDKKPVPFADGRAFMLDKSRFHSVRNDSKEDRIHLIIEGIFGDDPRWDDLITRSTT